MNKHKGLMEMLESADGILQKGGAASAKPEEKPIVENYSLDGLNLKGNVPLGKIVSAVRSFRDGTRRPAVDRPRMSILLSGVPGGGKSAFARYLANEVGAKLRSYRASDLLSKWIGESEKSLAAAFNVAEEEKSILFLDEVDSFLLARGEYSRSWEVSNVNELLQQMESFSGVLIAATNLVRNLDSAAMRRFTFKLELDYLTAEGKRKFFDRYFSSPLTAAEARRLDAIDNLAPGDFRTVKEQLFYVCENETNAERLAALEAEAAARHVKARIGF